MTTINDLPDALECRAALTKRLAGGRMAVFLDFDGTLAPVAETPDLAELPDPVRGVVRELSNRCLVAVISGRDREDVKAKVGLDGLIYAGSHGFDIDGPGGEKPFHGCAEYMEALAGAGGRLEHDLDGISGSLIERKRCSVAVHDRLVADADRPRIKSVVEAAVKAFPNLRIKPGKRVYEVLPDLDWDKGRAVEWLLRVMGLEDATAVYVGDDVTDEDAFRALHDTGIGVVVADHGEGRDGTSETHASYRLDGVSEVEKFLRMLSETSG